MTTNQAHTVINLLKDKGVSFDSGLSEKEIEGLKEQWNIVFPPDLKLFLQTALPVSDSFVHWRYGLRSEKGRKEIERWLRWPLEGMLFDIRSNNFWMEKWGDMPSDREDQIRIATEAFDNSPKLIPIYAHRYMPCSPCEMGNPVFSVYQTDIIHYGNDLASYLSYEFNLDLPDTFWVAQEPASIDFWSELVEMNGG